MVKIDFEKWNFQVHYNILDLNLRGINSITHLLSTIGLNWAWLILSNPWWDIVGGGGSDDAAAAVAVAVGVGGPVAAVQVILRQKPYQLTQNVTTICLLNYMSSTISFSSSNTQFYESWIFCLLTFWVGIFFQIKVLK